METKKRATKGITLIALVVTIVVLLILAGVSINLIIGQNGLIKKAGDAKNSSKQGEVTDRITAMLAEWQIEKYTTDGNFEAFLNGKKEANELDDVTDNGDGTFNVEKDGYILTIKDDGSILDASKVGPRPQISNIKVVANSDGTGDNLPAKGTDEGIKLYITFDHSIESGTTTVTPTLPFEVTKNGTYTFCVSDKAGNKVKYEETIIIEKIDDIPPKCDYIENEKWTNSNVAINFGCKDDESGCSKLTDKKKTTNCNGNGTCYELYTSYTSLGIVLTNNAFNFAPISSLFDNLFIYAFSPRISVDLLFIVFKTCILSE